MKNYKIMVVCQEGRLIRGYVGNFKAENDADAAFKGFCYYMDHVVELDAKYVRVKVSRNSKDVLYVVDGLILTEPMGWTTELYEEEWQNLHR